MAENTAIPGAVTALLPVFKGQVESANALALAVKGATQGAEAQVDHVLATSDDETIAKWRVQDANVRAQIARATAQLAENKAAVLERAKSLVADSPDVNVEETTKEYLSARAEITNMRKVFLDLFGKDEDRLKAFLAENGITEIVNLRKGSAGATIGRPKPRLAFARIGDTEYTKPTFTTLAKEIGVDIDDLKEVAFKAGRENGGTDEAPIPTDKVFTFTIVNAKKETVEVVLQGRSDKKATANVTADVDSEPETDSAE